VKNSINTAKEKDFERVFTRALARDGHYKFAQSSHTSLASLESSDMKQIKVRNLFFF